MNSSTPVRRPSSGALLSLALGVAAALGAVASCTKTETTSVQTCPVTCLNGGRCETGTCVCPSGYEGGSCQREWNAKFNGAYSYQSNSINLIASTVRPDLFVMSTLQPFSSIRCRRVDSLSFQMDSTSSANQGDFLTGGSGRIDETGGIVSGTYYIRSTWGGTTTRDTVEFTLRRY